MVPRLPPAALTASSRAAVEALAWRWQKGRDGNEGRPAAGKGSVVRAAGLRKNL